jgi:hypothetical protein
MIEWLLFCLACGLIGFSMGRFVERYWPERRGARVFSRQTIAAYRSRSHAVLAEMEREESAEVLLERSGIKDLIDEALVVGCERIWLKPPMWDSLVGAVKAVTGDSYHGVPGKSFMYWGMWCDRATPSHPNHGLEQ